MKLLLLRSLAGALMVALIDLLAGSRYFLLAGLAPLFPTFSLFAHYLVGVERGVEDLREVVRFGWWAMIPYALYLGVLYCLAGRTRLWGALGGAVTAWAVASYVLVTLWKH